MPSTPNHPARGSDERQRHVHQHPQPVGSRTVGARAPRRRALWPRCAGTRLVGRARTRRRRFRQPFGERPLRRVDHRARAQFSEKPQVVGGRHAAADASRQYAGGLYVGMSRVSLATLRGASPRECAGLWVCELQAHQSASPQVRGSARLA
ncbi:hypothetical protein BVI1335_1600005 [Burkholderia vietnamiensis]|nr:hypothetical protein BVI1335_1600005 [Burkholderia vietnamiensis]